MISKAQINNIKAKDIIWECCKYHWKQQLEVLTVPKYDRDCKVYVMNVKQIGGIWDGYDASKCIDNNNEYFLTEKEADDYINKCKQKELNNLDNKDVLIKQLYYKAESFLTDKERSIYRKKIKSFGIKL